MSYAFEKYESLQLFKTLRHDQIKFQYPIILRMYGLLNELNLKNENRYILCNFLDQNSEDFDLKEDIYKKNNSCSLNQLFLFAIWKAKEKNLIKTLYDEYISSIDAILAKRELSSF
jgi:hypothetical protein